MKWKLQVEAGGINRANCDKKPVPRWWGTFVEGNDQESLLSEDTMMKWMEVGRKGGVHLYNQTVKKALVSYGRRST